MKQTGTDALLSFQYALFSSWFSMMSGLGADLGWPKRGSKTNKEVLVLNNESVIFTFLSPFFALLRPRQMFSSSNSASV
jgi:hypothetical protein